MEFDEIVSEFVSEGDGPSESGSSSEHRSGGAEERFEALVERVCDEVIRRLRAQWED